MYDALPYDQKSLGSFSHRKSQGFDVQKELQNLRKNK